MSDTVPQLIHYFALTNWFLPGYEVVVLLPKLSLLYSWSISRCSGNIQ